MQKGTAKRFDPVKGYGIIVGDDACFVTAKGKKVYSETLEKSFKDYSVMMFVGKIKEDDFYKENGGE